MEKNSHFRVKFSHLIVKTVETSYFSKPTHIQVMSNVSVITAVIKCVQ